MYDHSIDDSNFGNLNALFYEKKKTAVWLSISDLRRINHFKLNFAWNESKNWIKNSSCYSF
jgi:hypothetical protein